MHSSAHPVHEIEPPAKGLLASPLSPAVKTWRDTELCQRELLRGIPVAVYSCDRDGILTYCNQAAAELWGRWLEVGKDSWHGEWNIFRADGSDFPPGECPMAAILRGRRPVAGENVIVQRPDGTHRYVLPYPECIRDNDGHLVGAVMTLVDLTESDAGRIALQSFRARQRAVCAKPQPEPPTANGRPPTRIAAP